MSYNIFVSFSFFGLFDIYVYGVIIAAAILVAFLVGVFLVKRAGIKEDIAYWILLICVPIGIAGARIYYLLFDSSVITNFGSFFDIRGGGMAIYGAVIGGALGLLLVSRIKKQGFFRLTDICVVVLILAQSIGRWGNFVNQEAYGVATEISTFPFAVWIDAENGYHLATFFYESFFNFIGFLVLLFIYLKSTDKSQYNRRGNPRDPEGWISRPGITTACYLIWYGIVRACIEPLRTDSLMLFDTVRVSLLLSIVLVILGVVLLVICLKTKLTATKKAK